ncbi:MAG: hypothetical protein WCV86_01100 [Patescibacteria group bacterium]|jgi:hypothetical protein
MSHPVNINGFKAEGDAEGIAVLKHKDEMVSRMLFTQAAEAGEIVFHGNKDEPYRLRANPDYTFQVLVGESEGTFH